MIIKSDFYFGENIPLVNTCLGDNVSPPLFIEEVPDGTKSLVLIFEDLDALPKPKTHWLLFNIPPGTTQIIQGSTPGGALESIPYGGPCPRDFDGIHHFWFRLYALDTFLDLPATATRDEVEEKIKSSFISKAELLALSNSHLE